MIILNDKPNQLCNRIWSQAPLVAKCLGDNGEIIIPFFGEYAHLFENLNRINNIRFSPNKGKYFQILLRFSIKCLRIIPPSLLALFNIYFLQKKTIKADIPYSYLDKKKSLLFASAWEVSFFNKFLLANHTQLREIYAPAKASKSKVENLFELKKNQFDIIVGIHIRRGDYKTYKNGLYFFEDATYEKLMKQLKNEKCTRDKRVGFLICSNEPINLSTLHLSETFQIENSNEIEDLYGLSLCDFILGPPSSYSMWASFYGGKPLCLIKSDADDISLRNFKVVIAQNLFENGDFLSI